MADASLPLDGFFARGIETITHRGRPIDRELPELPGLQRLAPTDWQRPPALDELLAGHTLDRHIDAAIRPVIHEPELLLPRSFARILEQAQHTLERAGARHGYPVVLQRAQQVLAQEHEWRELARTYREALYQA
jgi:hypothetical protein